MHIAQSITYVLYCAHCTKDYVCIAHMFYSVVELQLYMQVQYILHTKVARNRTNVLPLRIVILKAGGVERYGIYEHFGCSLTLFF